MCSLMLTVHAAPTSVPLVQGACCDICLPVHQKYETELNPPHMNWVELGPRRQHKRKSPGPNAMGGWPIDMPASSTYVRSASVALRSVGGCPSI